MTTNAIDQTIEALIQAAVLKGQATTESSEHLLQSHDYVQQCQDALREAIRKSQEVQVAALCEAQSVLNSLNRSRRHEVIVNDTPCYWQTKEWVEWAGNEVLAQVTAAMKGLTCPCCAQDGKKAA